MAPTVDREFINKIEAVVQGPSGALLREFVDFLYFRQTGIDAEPLAPEELAMLKESQEQIQRGEIENWEDFKRRHNL
jgi:hypothetical protein